MSKRKRPGAGTPTIRPVAGDTGGKAATPDLRRAIQAAADAFQRGEWPEAERLCRLVLQSKSGNFAALYLLGLLAGQARRSEEAIELLSRAVAVNPSHAAAWVNRGNALSDNHQPDAALRSYDKAIALQPDFAEAHYNRGNTLRELKQHEAAVHSYDRAIALKPDYAEAHSNRGIALQEQKRFDAAVQSYDRAIALKPGYAEAWNNRGDAQMKSRRFVDAVQSYTRLLAISPDFPFAKGQLLHAKMHCCDWAALGELYQSIRDDVRSGRNSAEPFAVLAISDSAEELQLCAQRYAAEKYPRRNVQLSVTRALHKPKIRIGYLSGEFRDQATSILMAELFELHDKSRFEVFAFDNGWDDGGELRPRMNRAFDEMVDIRRLGDPEAAAAINQRDIDILVSLNGYFGEARPGVFSYRPSPIQVNYLGFPGTLGAEYMDYLIADKTLIPDADQKHYCEKIAYLPDCYQANDRKRRISDKAFRREEMGLPPTAFVFCSFNNNFKITPAMFDGWMRLLKRVEGSVLWLLQDNPAAADNLRREATQRGVGAERLVFAKRMPLTDHLARHRLADLFLDTLPCNAHTTASDALWAGLPVLTCLGATFAGRVAASLLSAIHLPELITTTQEEYEALAVELAANPQRLAQIRQKLEQNRLAAPLFDTPRFTKHIEAAYAAMYERYHAGFPPEHIHIQQ